MVQSFTSPVLADPSFAGAAHELLGPQRNPGFIHAEMQGLRQSQGMGRLGAMTFAFGNLFS
jgi:hypothetical protein